jgi:hypothetical protein
MKQRNRRINEEFLRKTIIVDVLRAGKLMQLGSDAVSFIGVDACESRSDS